MLFSRAGRGVFRHLPSSTCTFTYRVDPLALSCARAYTSNSDPKSFALPLRLRSELNSQSIARRFYASKPTSRSKARTTRATTSRARKPAPAQGKKTRSTGTTKKSTRTRAKPKKAKAKAKSPAKKPRRASKTLTPKQQEAAAASERRALIRELKSTAQKPPKKLPETTFTIITAEKGKEAHGLAPREASAKYRQLVPEEREHYNRLATENKTKNNATYKAWVESLTPEDIRKANLARKRLKRMGVKGYSNQIQDPRQVKRPANARSLFIKDRFESGDMRGVSIVEANKLIGREWNELPQNQKQRYFASEMERRAQYIRDVKNIYHRDIVLNGNLQAAQALHA